VADTVIHWFRRDLRLDDNTAFSAALRSGDRVLPVFIIDDAIVGHGIGEHRLRFLRTALVDLDAQLQDRGSRLLVRRGDAPRELNRIAEEVTAWGAYLNRDYTPYGRQRDTRATRGLQMTGVVTQTFDDLLLVSPHATLDADGLPAADFDGFRERWLERLDLDPAPASIAGQLVPAAEMPDTIPDWPESIAPGLERPSEWPGATPRSAHERLGHFISDHLAGYPPSGEVFGGERVEGTSRLSAALKFGTISVREVARAALRRAAADETCRSGAEHFISRLSRRDYAHHLLHARPDLLRTWGFEGDGEAAETVAGIAAWAEGRTGRAGLDDGMRRMIEDGWVPESVRRELASALVTDIGASPRVGARHFARHLVDFDVACDLLGWLEVAVIASDGRTADRLP
jgi:deoxyribodipyrimidine photo-lyase